jgi:phenylalanyl-tRNA synthetase beta subunit
LPEQTRSLAYAIRLGAEDRTLSEKEVGQVRDELIAAAGALGASLRG